MITLYIPVEAQFPGYIRDRAFGTSGRENNCYFDVSPTGVLFAGISDYLGIEFDKSDSSCVGLTSGQTDDFWLIRADLELNPVWNKAIGGNRDERSVTSVLSTLDGNWLVAGLSLSDSSCLKSENSRGSYDIWLLKLDDSGNILQQRTFGTDKFERCPRVIELDQGGYLVICGSEGGISGDKTVVGYGGFDIWMLRLDHNFNIIWQSTLGSSGDEGFFGASTFYFYGLVQINTNLIALGVTGEDMLANGSISAVPYNSTDVWLALLDSSGNILWNGMAGSPFDPPASNIQPDIITDVESTSDGGFIFCGFTGSTQGGTVLQQPEWDDVWVQKYDSTGNLIWSKLYGGYSSEFAYSIVKAVGGGYWISGQTNSPAGLDIGTGPFGTSLDYWVFKIDENGTLLYEQRLGGPGSSGFPKVRCLPDSTVIVCGQASAGQSPVKNHPGYGTSTDYWAVQFQDITLSTGLNSGYAPSHWSAYPNPVQDELTVSGLKAGRLNWRLLSVQGQVIAQGNETVQQQWRLNMQAYAQGLYFLELEQHNERGVVRVVRQ
jgi:hypothetical protein